MMATFSLSCSKFPVVLAAILLGLGVGISGQDADNAGSPERPSYFNGFYKSALLRGDQAPTMNADIAFGFNSSSPDIFDVTMDLAQREKACLETCKEHGSCDALSWHCNCETFWTMNPFIAKGRPYRPNCDWNVFVVIGTLIGIVFSLIILSILLYGCCRRCTPEAKLPSRRYRLIPDDDLEGYGKGGAGLRIKRAQMVDSDEDEDDEAVFEAKNPRFYGTNANTYRPAGETSKTTKTKVIPQ